MRDDEHRIAIVGSRDYPRLELVGEAVCDIWESMGNFTLVSGGAAGVDRAAESMAKTIKVDTLIFPADWQRYGRRAGYMRNEQIVEASDLVIAFQKSGSRGTQLTIDIATREGVPVLVYDETGAVIRDDTKEA